MSVAELTAPIVEKSKEKRIVTGPVLIPGEPDSDGDVLSAEQIEELADAYMEHYGNVDIQHSLKNVARPLRSWITEEDKVYKGVGTVPKGSWMMSVRVQDDAAWDGVKKGKFTGFSIMGMRAPAYKSATALADHVDPEAMAAVMKSAQKRTTLADLGPDWFVNAVSLVDDPAVPKAKFIAIKSKDDNGDTSGGSWFGKLFGSLKNAPPQPPQQPPPAQPQQPPAGDISAEQVTQAVEVLVAFVNKLKAANGQQPGQPQQQPPGQPPMQKSKGDDNVDKAEFQAMINAAVKAALKGEDKDASTTPEGGDKATKGTTDTGDQPDGAQKDSGGELVSIPKADYDALVAQVNELSGVAQKAKNSGMLFGSRSMFGQDGDQPDGATKSAPDPMETESRDAWGRYIEPAKK